MRILATPVPMVPQPRRPTFILFIEDDSTDSYNLTLRKFFYKASESARWMEY
jgi:hypothetical protein